MIAKYQRDHRLDHWHRTGQHTRIVTTARREGGFAAINRNSALLLANGGRGLEGHPQDNRLAIADAALNATRAISKRPNPLTIVIKLVVVLFAGKVGAAKAGANFKAFAGWQRHDRFR